ncbi:MAG: LptA/OstA family protein [Leptolyngbyaceae cyanobacterium MO_188.B28]|nr:LptA/OstA family protein [Leptolyngbyaceae cyanobacterium MO_188.B28]
MALLFNRLRYRLTPLISALTFLGGVMAASPFLLGVRAQPSGEGGSITLRSDVQEANSNTGVITARGNVQIEYPAQQIYATSAQAQYFSQERRIVLSGDVYVSQQGNSLRAETVTYLIDEGRFLALPQPDNQVEAVYVIPANQSSAPGSPASVPDASSSPPASLDLRPISPIPEASENSVSEESDSSFPDESQDGP